MNPSFFTQRWLPGPPWLHFIVLGTALYWQLLVWFPSPAPVLGPPSPARLQLLVNGYAQMVGESPNSEQMERFIDRELRDEVLFREAVKAQLYREDSAVIQRIIRNMLFLFPDDNLSHTERIARGLSLNMHLTDEVIRRRLIQMMEQWLVASARLTVIPEEELRLFFNANTEQFMAPARISFAHVFLGGVDVDQAQRVFMEIQRQQLDPQQALQLGTAFLEGYRFNEVRWTDINSRFGRDFSAALKARVQDGQLGWLGVIPSVFGAHVVFIEDYRPAYRQSFEEVRGEIQWQLTSAREQTVLNAEVDALMMAYEVRRS